MNLSPKLILLGDTHGFIKDFEKQEEVIKKYNPEFILSEMLEDNILDSDAKFIEILEKKDISNMTSVSEIENLIKLCMEKKINLIGMDFKDFGFDKNLQEKIKNQSELNEEEQKEIETLLDKRERKNVETIKEYLGKTAKPIIVITGSWHLREDSPLRTSFKGYKMIYPSNSKGELVLEPTDEKISWGEK
ncbi:Uncharacterised protein [uncultured archaeon]|nr:Uncharacterised protein [uncultured archaeon]